MGQGSEAAPESFSQHPRYMEMCVRVMEAALQQGLASSIPAWSQAVLQNIRATCKMPRAELTRSLAGFLLSFLPQLCPALSAAANLQLCCVSLLLHVSSYFRNSLLHHGNIIGMYT